MGDRCDGTVLAVTDKVDERVASVDDERAPDSVPAAGLSLPPPHPVATSRSTTTRTLGRIVASRPPSRLRDCRAVYASFPLLATREVPSSDIYRAVVASCTADAKKSHAERADRACSSAFTGARSL